MKEKINLNRTQIKHIAIAAMILDHVAAFLLPPDKQPEWIVLYIIMRTIGRIAAPVMFYFLVEGFVHTSSKRNYCLRLMSFAILSQIPYSLVRYGSVASGDLNVMFTLLFSFFMLMVVEKTSNQVVKGMAVAVFMFISVFSDWGLIGPLMTWLFYVNRSDRKKQIRNYLLIVGIQLLSAVLFIICNTQSWYEGICQLGAFLLIPMFVAYNGEAGKKNWINKWVFYLFYPLHLLLILFVK